MPEPTKTCRVCGEIKPLTEFHRNGGTRDRRHSWCKPCVLRYKRERWAKATPTQRAEHAKVTRERRHRQLARMSPEALEAYNASRRIKSFDGRAQSATWQLLRRHGAVSDETREMVPLLLRDVCTYCGCDLGRFGQLDHIDAAEASSEWENLTAACHACNSGKNNIPLLNYLLILRLREDRKMLAGQIRLLDPRNGWTQPCA